MSRLSDISSSPTLKQFAQGVAQDAIQPVADFLAPGVDVDTMTGKYKIYDEKNRFRVPNTLRAMGGRATELIFSATDATYDCSPRALDYPVDNLEQLESGQLEDRMKEGAVAVAEVASLAHEQDVINAALAAVGSGTNKTWNSSADPIDDIDSAILTVLQNCGYGSAITVGLLFGPTAFRIFKNAEKVRNKFVVGKGGKGDVGFAIPTLDTMSGLFMGNTESVVSYMVYDTQPEGKTASRTFLLSNQLIIFARKSTPTRRDPSFMKTFRLRGNWMVPGSYIRDDGRSEVAKFDWSGKPVVSNSTAAIRYNIASS